MDTPVGELLARRRDKGAPNGLEAPAPAGTVRSPPASPPSPRVVLSGGSTAGARALDDEPNFYDIGTATPGLTGKGVVLRSTPASVYRAEGHRLGCLGLLVVITTGATIIALGSGSASSSSTVPPHLPSPLPPPSPTPSLPSAARPAAGAVTTALATTSSSASELRHHNDRRHRCDGRRPLYPSGVLAHQQRRHRHRRRLLHRYRRC